MKKYVIRFWILFVGLIGLSFLFFYGTAHWNLLGEMPSTQKLENPKFYLASEIYSSDNKLIGTYYTDNRINAEYHEIPQHLIDALVATEDKRFFEHSGIDARGLGRAIAGAFVGGRGGASTITQQLSKMMFTGKRSSNVGLRVIQKFKEWVMAVQIEQLYTKEEIITMYFNQFDFLHSSVGVYNASRVYFNKNLKDLSVPEAASLVAMFKSPVIYNPKKKDNSKALDRRNTILQLMANQDYIDKNKLEKYQNTKLKVSSSNSDDTNEYAAYFKENVRMFMKKWCKDNGYNLYKDGLKIYTTIDFEMQKNAEYAVKKHLKSSLQPAFEREWKRRKNGPFHFNTGSAQKENKALQEILYQGMRKSKRYKKHYAKELKIVKAHQQYLKAKYPLTVEQDSLHRLRVRISEQVFDKRILLKKKDLKYFEEARLDFVDDLLDDLYDDEKDLMDEISDLKEDANDAYKAYEKLWIPFDEKMKIHFNKKVKMKIFTWDKTISKTMTPLDSIFHHKKYLRTGLCSIDAQTGQIKAWVGGINHKHFQYDHVNAKRQAGSSFKPFVYATALNMGASPSTPIINKEITFKKGEYDIPEDWTPKNSGSKKLEYEFITLKTGLAKSINWVAAQLIKGRVHNVVETAKNFGITSHIAPLPSICLGTTDVSPKEMSSAYSAFANNGIRCETSFILRIEDKRGKVLYTHAPKNYKVISKQTSKGMLSIMAGNTQSFKDGNHQIVGTGYRLRRNVPYGGIPISTPIYGKTGTTQNSSDGWYIGICDNIATAVWVGCEDRSAHFLNGGLGQGANMALPIWGYYMKKNLK